MSTSIKPVDWKPVSLLPEARCGWFAGALLPVNHDESTVEMVNSWREKFGFTKVWYNADAIEPWREADFHGGRARPITGRLTHWGELPAVPLIPELAETPAEG